VEQGRRREVTSFEMKSMLKSIRVKREGSRLLISGRAIVDGKSAGFLVARKIPADQTPKLPQLPPYKILWLDELSNFNFNTKGVSK
jgi:hypothetical protein